MNMRFVLRMHKKIIRTALYFSPRAPYGKYHRVSNYLRFVQLFLSELLPHQIQQCLRTMRIFSFVMSMANLLNRNFYNDNANLTISNIYYDGAILIYFVTQFDAFVKKRVRRKMFHWNVNVLTTCRRR